MAILQVNFFSELFCRTVTANVILPADKSANGSYVPREKPYKTLYLLHGYSGNYADWVHYTRIQHWAEERDLAVVMPSGENGYYVDSLLGDFGEFVGRELVEVTRRMFPLSNRREDTYLAGLSMGGYGAIRNGLKYWPTFSCIAGLSSALHFFETPRAKLTDPRARLFQACGVESPTDENPRVAYREMERGCLERGLPKTRIYMACGTSDSLLPGNRTFRDYLQSRDAALTYVEAPGKHNWDFWNDQILKVLKWLPLGDDYLPEEDA